MKLQLSKVIGHRGACGYAPENTLASLSKAHEIGARWVEFDVMLAGSGELIVIHDFTLDRTTNGSGEVSSSHYDYIATLDCGSWFSEKFSDEKIPTLIEVINHISTLDLGINVEIKPYPGSEKQTTCKTLDILDTYWPKSSKAPLLSSFSQEVLYVLSDFKNDYPRGYIIDSWEHGWQSTLEKNQCVSIHVNQHILTPDYIKEIKQMGKLVLAYTVNDAPRAKQLFDWGVDSIFSDYPDKMFEVI